MSKIRMKHLGIVFMAIFIATVHSLQYAKKQPVKYESRTKRIARDTNQIGSTTENTTDYLLPDNVIPTEYFIRLTPFIIPDNFTFDGVVKIIADVKKSTSKIVLHADAEIHGVTVQRVNGNNVPLGQLEVVSFTKTEKYQFLNLVLKSPINAGTKISIEISYTGTLFPDSVGFFRSAYKVNNEQSWMLGSHLEPAQARYVFPCFDEPRFKAVFHMSVVVPPKYTAISNMPVKSVKGSLVEFQKTPPMSTYIIAVVVSKFQSQTKFHERHPYKAWSNPELINHMSYALNVMSKAIDFFESNLGIPYTLSKLEIVAMPDFIAGAMENWGLPLYRESFVVFDPKVTPLFRQRFIRNAVTHELTHQWFGNMVTPQRWDYLWVSEAFAAYFEYHAHEEALNSWNLESQFVVNEMQPSFASDALVTSESAVRNVYSVDEIIGIFDVINYTKGASLVRMLQKLLGSTMFYGALHRYLHKNQFSLGTPELLYAAIEEELRFKHYNLNTDVASLMNSWTRKAGFPVINANFNGDTVTLSQKRFLLKPENTTDESTWVVPVNWATRSNPNFSNTGNVVWLTGKQKSVTIKNACDDWVILNVQQTGYYRVNYDTNMWNRIINVLKSKHCQVIHEVNRASLVDDLLNLARAGMVDYDLALSGTKYLTQERSYVPWRAAFEGFTYLKRRFVGHPEIYNAFKVYVKSLLQPNYNRLGFHDIAGEELLDTHLRELVLNWMCDLEHEDCVNQALNEWNKLQRDSSYVVPANQQVVVYCTAVKHGSTDNWNYLWRKLQGSNNAIEKLTILSALACSQNPTNLERLLLNTITPDQGIRKHDVDTVFTNVIEASPIGVQTTLKFIGENYEKMQEYAGDDGTTITAINGISGLLPTQQLIKEFDNFVKTNKEKMSGIVDTLESALESANYELNWYTKNAPKILNWIRANYPSA